MNPKWVYPDPTNTDEPVIVSRCCPTCDALAARLAEAERLLAGAHYHKSCAKVSEDEWWAAYHEFFATADSASAEQVQE
jgi:hypothetical protein